MSRVAIVGTGPSGLSQLRAFSEAQRKGADIPEIVCYEKQSYWGGLWNFTWRTGTDEYGESVHCSMYRYLWSNGPKECLEFADYTFEEHFGGPIPSFPPREVLTDYITARAAKSDVRKYVQFSTPVRSISYSDSSQKFTVTSENLHTNTMSSEEFDYVIVATGHFSVPNIPYFEGIERFPGRVIHAHDFRDAQEFAGQNVLVIGASYSAEDIGLQCHKYGAKSVTMSYRTAAMGFKWPETIEEHPLLTKIEDSTVHFKDGSSKEVDAIIMCTGYLHHFPFINDDLRLKTHNRLNPPKIYQGIFWEDNPKMMYLGMQDQFYTLSMFDAQAWYARDVILGRITLPSKEEMGQHIAKWVDREEKLENPFQQIDFQADYIRELCAETDYPEFDIDGTVNAFKEWEHDKEENILGYRDQQFKSPCTGTLSPPHHTTWLEAMDDSMVTYLNVKE